MAQYAMPRKPVLSARLYEPLASQVEDDRTDTLSHNERASKFTELVEFTTSSPAPPVARMWPSSPRHIQRTIRGLLSDLLVDIIMYIASTTFLTFALAVKVYDGQRVDIYIGTTHALKTAAQYGPTVFPILFACVVSRATHAILMWRLVKGERIGVLDVLAGSTSLTSTVLTQLRSGFISILGPALILAWALSPIGGQASLRVIGEKQSTHVLQIPLKYRVPNGDLFLYERNNPITRYAIAANNFVASIVAPEVSRTDVMDIWGNIKIPLIGQYETESSNSSNQWHAVNRTARIDFASWIGIPISLQTTQTANINDGFAFNIETSYVSPKCVITESLLTVPFNDTITKRLNQSLEGNGFQLSGSINDTARWLTANLTQLPLRQFFLKDNSELNMYNCTLETVYVESEVTCNSTTVCEVTKLRRSTLSHPTTTFTLLDNYLDLGWVDFASHFMQAFPSESNVVNALTAYVFNSTYVSRNSDDIVSLRFGQMMNTYMTSLYLYKTATIQVDIDEIGSYGEEQGRSSIVKISDIAETTAVRTSTFQVIDCRLPWMITLFMISIFLIAASVIPTILRFFATQGPDIFLNFSSLAIRDNPYVDLPKTGTYLGGSERAKLARNHRIRFGDIDERGAAGILVIGSNDKTARARIGAIRRDRLYL